MHPKVTKKAVTKAISLRTKKVFLVKCSVSSCQEKKNFMTYTFIFAKIDEKFDMGNVHASQGQVVVANIVLHFYLSSVNIFR